MTAISIEYSDEYLEKIVQESCIRFGNTYILHTNDLIFWMNKKAIPLKNRAKLVAEAHNYVQKLNRQLA